MSDLNIPGPDAIDLSQNPTPASRGISIPAIIGALILVSATLVFVVFAIIIYRRRIIARSTGTVDYDSFHRSPSSRTRAEQKSYPLPFHLSPTDSIYHRPLADPPHRTSYQLHDPPIVQTSPRKHELGRISRRSSGGGGGESGVRRGGSQYRGGLSRINEYGTEELAERIHRKARERAWPVVERAGATRASREYVREDDVASSTLPYLSTSTSIAALSLPSNPRYDSPPPPSYPLPPLPLFSTTSATRPPSQPLPKSPNSRIPISSIYSHERAADDQERTLDSIEHAIEQEFGLGSPSLPNRTIITSGGATRRREDRIGAPSIPLKNSLTSTNVASAQIISRPDTRNRQNHSGSLLPSPRLAQFDIAPISPTGSESFTVRSGYDDALPLIPMKNPSLLARFRSNTALSTLSKSQHNLLSLSHLGMNPLTKKPTSDEITRARAEKSPTNTDPFLSTPRMGLNDTGSRAEAVQYRIPSIVGVEGLDFSRLGFDSPSPVKGKDVFIPHQVDPNKGKQQEDYFGDFSRSIAGKENTKSAPGRPEMNARPVSNCYSDASEYDTPVFSPQS